MITVNTGKCELVFVPVPDDTLPIEVNQCTLYYETEGEVKYFSVPDGEWQIIGFTDELTEDDLKLVFHELIDTSYPFEITSRVEQLEELISDNNIIGRQIVLRKIEHK